MGEVFDTEHLAKFVSSMLGWRVNVVLGDYRNMPDGYLGVANWEMICLRSSLVRNMDPILPRVFFHELGHIVLHKRDGIGDMTQEEKEREAEMFASHMLLSLGDDFVWDGLRGELNYDLERRAKTEIMQFADSKIFRRNQVKPQPYSRTHLTYFDQEMIQQSGQRRTTAQPQRMTATGLQAQGQREMALASRVQATNPTVAAMIKRSAEEKLGTAKQHSGRRGVDNYSNAPLQKATLYR